MVAYCLLASMALTFGVASPSKKIRLNNDQLTFIAEKVWQNEAAGNLEYLLYWSPNESFLSLGLAHFIWYAEGNRSRYREMFPLLVDYLAGNNVRLPGWLDAKTACPWENRKAFQKAKESNTKKYQELYELLVRTMPIQAEFIIERMQDSLRNMLSSIKNQKEKKRLKRNYHNVLHDENGTVSIQGLYEIVDYVNFKGEGTSLKERYHGEGWGLRQVLQEMDENTENPRKAFADAAKKVLERRIDNAPPDRNETRWKKGWFKRIDSYTAISADRF